MASVAPLLYRKRIIQIANENTKGTYDFDPLRSLLCFDASIQSTAEFIERRGPGKYLGHVNIGAFGQETGVFTCKAELRGNGSNAMDAAVSEMLMACGMKNTSEAYTPSSTITDHKTVSITVWEDGKKKQLKGAMGNCVISGEQGMPIYLEFTMTGFYVQMADEALSTPTWSANATLPEVMGSGALTFGALTVYPSKFQLDFGNNVVERSGSGYFVITDRTPILSIDVEDDNDATADYPAIRIAGTQTAFSMAIGSAAGKMITVAAPKVQIQELKEADRNGILTYDLTGLCTANTGDDEYSITVKTA